jgi:site-specific DNA-methyltransferase (adenine-specific)
MSDTDPTTRRTPDATHDKDEWRTPPELFAGLDLEFKFTLDPCATKANALCATYFTRSDDGMAQPWGGHRVFMNPPYRRGELARWVEKAYTESRHGFARGIFGSHVVTEPATVVGLLPATRSEQPWWHDFVLKAGAEVRWLRGRLRYLMPDGSTRAAASFPSVIVIWR